MSAEIILGGVTVCSLLLNVWLEHRFARRDTVLRMRLGACRTSLAACEKQFNAQAVELARYRGQVPHHQRLTRIFTGLPQPPEDE
jgi:hypothetical protein